MRYSTFLLLVSLLLPMVSCATLDANYGSYRASEQPVRSGFPHVLLDEQGWVGARVGFEGEIFNVFAWKQDSLNSRLLMYQNQAAKRPFARLERAVRRLESQGEQVLLAANAGMYAEDLTPLGLYIEKGSELFPAHTGGGEGNFALLPNGVFFFGEQGFGVAETKSFLQSEEYESAQYATQSGPLLLNRGDLHSRFTAGSANRYVRSGVGVPGSGYQERVFFVISESPVNFSVFARFFREGLGCSEALYLDGHTSRAYIPSLDREQDGGRFGPLLLVSDPAGRDRFDFNFSLEFSVLFGS